MLCGLLLICSALCLVIGCLPLKSCHAVYLIDVRLFYFYVLSSLYLLCVEVYQWPHGQQVVALKTIDQVFYVFVHSICVLQQYSQVAVPTFLPKKILYSFISLFMSFMCTGGLANTFSSFILDIFSLSRSTSAFPGLCCVYLYWKLLVPTLKDELHRP